MVGETLTWLHNEGVISVINTEILAMHKVQKFLELKYHSINPPSLDLCHCGNLVSAPLRNSTLLEVAIFMEEILASGGTRGTKNMTNQPLRTSTTTPISIVNFEMSEKC